LGVPSGRDHLEDPELDERKILKLIFRKRKGGTEWIKLAINTNWLWNLVNAVMNFNIP